MRPLSAWCMDRLIGAEKLGGVGLPLPPALLCRRAGLARVRRGDGGQGPRPGAGRHRECGDRALLTQEGFRSPRHRQVLVNTVSAIRRRHRDRRKIGGAAASWLLSRCSLAEGGCAAWMLRLVKIGVEGEVTIPRYGGHGLRPTRLRRAVLCWQAWCSRCSNGGAGGCASP